MISDLLSAAKELDSLKLRLRDARERDRAALADFLGKIVDCIAAMLEKMTEGARPVTECAELEVYCKNAKPIIEKIVGQAGALLLCSSLDEVFRAPGFFLLGICDSTKNEDLLFSYDQFDELREAIGLFRGTAVLLRAPDVRPSIAERVLSWIKSRFHPTTD